MRRKHEEPPENLERWLLTYADMITLLMAFFTILFAMASVDAVKFKTLAQSMSIAFSGGGGGGQNIITNFDGTGITPQVSSNSMVTLRENNQFKAIIKSIMEFAEKQGFKAKIESKITDKGLLFSFRDSVLFESGKADLSQNSQKILDQLADVLLKNNRIVRVEGHTDNVPIHTTRYVSNWQLSTDRATNVIMYWISKYPDQAQYLSAAGYGEFHPIASNSTPDGRSLNRRVEIVIPRESVNQKESSPFVSPPPVVNP